MRSCSSLTCLISAHTRGGHRIVLGLRPGARQNVATAAAVASACSVSCPLLMWEGLPFLAGTFLGTSAKAIEEDLSLGEQTCALCCICCDQPQSDGEGGNVPCASGSCYANMHSCYFCFACQSSPGTLSLESITGPPSSPLKDISCLCVALVSPRTYVTSEDAMPPLLSIRQSQTQFSFTSSRLEGLGSQLLLMTFERARPWPQVSAPSSSEKVFSISCHCL